MDYYLAVKTNESLLHEKTRVNHKNMILRKMPDTKEYILYDFIVTKFNNRQK